MSDEILVTDEMIEAVDSEFMSGCCIVDTKTCVEIYRAMATARGAIKLSSDQITWFNNVVAILPEKNREIATLQADNRRLEEYRDQWRQEAQSALDGEGKALEKAVHREIRICNLEAENAALKQGLDYAGDIIAALQLRLAKATVFVDSAPEPPKPNPFREFSVDRRRMGPLV